MEPNLKVGDRVLTARAWIAYPGGKMPLRGDIIVFRMPLPPETPEEEKSASSGENGDSGDKGFAAQIRAKLIDRQKKGDLLIKRVIGLPGETVVVKDNRVYINGRSLQEDYKIVPSPTNFAEFATEEKPLKVPEGELFMLGDNRATSDDGRFWGTLRREEIVGKFIRVLYNDGGVSKRVAEEQKSGN
jgi:signal peptidase I